MYHSSFAFTVAKQAAAIAAFNPQKQLPISQISDGRGDDNECISAVQRWRSRLVHTCRLRVVQRCRLRVVQSNPIPDNRGPSVRYRGHYLSPESPSLRRRMGMRQPGVCSRLDRPILPAPESSTTRSCPIRSGRVLPGGGCGVARRRGGGFRGRRTRREGGWGGG